MAHTTTPTRNGRAPHASTMPPGLPGPGTPATSATLHTAASDGAGV
ncbi:hypothetical protein ABT369_03565 [Dactylosporangium sp. NPDC000244]